MISIIPRTVKRWLKHDGMGLAAAVSFYSIFAISPLFLLIVTISSRWLSNEESIESIGKALADVFPDTSSESLLNILRANANIDTSGGLSITSIILLVWAASVVLIRLQVCTRRIFEDHSGDWKGELKMSVTGRGKALIFTLVTGTLIAFLSAASSLALPMHQRLLELDESMIIEGILTAILTLGAIILIRLSVTQRIPLGALIITAVFLCLCLCLGRFGVSLYLMKSSIAGAYGVASSIVVVLIWIFFAANFYGLSVALCAELSERKEEAK